ncbi:hypothetical protein SBA3_1790023 [Candidatus Sulfopaludibacter sp. SbA3]|nr:hypothetical protein SBA3_1790023 [Candidatus Sulfopaludibacter sp. SbA3]
MLSPLRTEYRPPFLSPRGKRGDSIYAPAQVLALEVWEHRQAGTGNSAANCRRKPKCHQRQEYLAVESDLSVSASLKQEKDIPGVAITLFAQR